MNAKQIVLALVAFDFTALTGYALYEMGPAGLWEAMTANIMTITAAVDLCIALFLGCWWMVRDAKQFGINPVPYIILTLFTGSLGPLLFLIKREGAVLENRLPADATLAAAH